MSRENTVGEALVVTKIQIGLCAVVEHINTYAIFKRAQLFERFGALQRSWFPFHELEQHLAAESIDTLMPQIFYSRKIARVWDGGAREIERTPRKIDNNFHLMRRGR